jgi:hypothetical protein
MVHKQIKQAITERKSGRPVIDPVDIKKSLPGFTWPATDI